ncbi:hypothetical protein VL20_4467 [Microcystis panniformis FACHB-1757]|uniref:Uncharacterized protein n=1 Tax=Microcystis panniformis FACHB-1757 TaxID=1638788 RepID=A0A0K1S5P9_9CHRO|nr:hypothetical protein VL20_4467 [Microcystis panniformis FACHB-1757]
MLPEWLEPSTARLSSSANPDESILGVNAPFFSTLIWPSGSV